MRNYRKTKQRKNAYCLITAGEVIRPDEEGIKTLHIPRNFSLKVLVSDSASQMMEYVVILS